MITNRSFIESRTFDGFRKCVLDEFSYAYIIDTKSDVRANPKIAGTTHNVFGIQTGVAIMFLVRKEGHEGKCRIEYVAMDDFWRKEEKLTWLRENKLKDIGFDKIEADKNNNWINLADSDFESLIPLVSKHLKAGRNDNALFRSYSLGVKTNRDEWVVDFNRENLSRKVNFLISGYSSEIGRISNEVTSANLSSLINYEIKWTRKLKRLFLNKVKIAFNNGEIIPSFYRPFSTPWLYFSDSLIEDLYQVKNIFSKKGNENNRTIIIAGVPLGKPFHLYVTDNIFHHDTLEKTQGLPLYIYDKDENKIENITDWGLEQFHTNYKNKKITKEDIFHYTYAVLHNPAYRKKYELNLKREFPRLPFYEDFKKWSTSGKKLMDLHINYEDAKPYTLKEITHADKAEHKKEMKKLFEKAEEPEALYSRKPKIKAKLKANKEEGIIELDELTILTGVPKEAWEYKLGNRSALEWVLDQYKEKKPSDPTIAEKFNTYRFADYKEHVIELLKKVCTVSVETMKIINEMERLSA